MVSVNERLIEAYTAILTPEAIAQFEGKDNGLAGVFLPSAPVGAMDLMIVGMETKRWNGAFGKIRSGDLSTYITSSMELHQRHLNTPPKRSSFRQFHNQVSKRLGRDRNQIGWGNILAVSYKGATPVRCSAFEAIQQLSASLLRKQIEIIRPKTIIFVCGWRYDNYLKQCLDGLITDSKVRTPKALWQFQAGDSLCFRTSHPRYVSGSHYREEALALALNHIAKTSPNSAIPEASQRNNN